MGPERRPLRSCPFAGASRSFPIADSVWKPQGSRLQTPRGLRLSSPSLNGPLIPIPHIFRAIPTFLKIQSSFFSCCCLRTSQPESEHACGMDYSLVMWYRLPPSSKPVRKDPVPELCFFIFRADNFCYQERRVIKLRIFLSVLLRPFR